MSDSLIILAVIFTVLSTISAWTLFFYELGKKVGKDVGANQVIDLYKAYMTQEMGKKDEEIKRKDDAMRILIDSHDDQIQSLKSQLKECREALKPKKHWGDCSVYQAMAGDYSPEAGICTCGYGLYLTHTEADPSEMYSKERFKALNKGKENKG